MSQRPSSYSGCAVALLLFVVLGVPVLVVATLGERACDMHVGPPCTVSWGWTKLITIAVVIAICAFFGLLAGLLSRLRRRRGDPADGDS
jgi:hypothetical protein